MYLLKCFSKPFELQSRFYFSYQYKCLKYRFIIVLHYSNALELVNKPLTGLVRQDNHLELQKRL